MTLGTPENSAIQKLSIIIIIIPCWLFSFSREFLLQILCCLYFYLWSFSYTSHAGFTFLWGVSLTHPMLASFFNLGSFSYTFRAGFFFYIYRRSFSYRSRAGFICVWGVSLTHPVLASFLCGDFLLHIPCWLHFYVGSFSYTSCAGFLSFFFI